MKILLVYDSKFGNTEKIAQAMKEVLDKANAVTLVRAADAVGTDFSGYEMVIVGSPINGGWPAPLAKAFLDRIPVDALKGKKAAAFDTGSTPKGQNFFGQTAIKIFGHAAPRTAKMLESKGAEVLKFETFYVIGYEGPIVDGEIERAQQWVAQLL